MRFTFGGSVADYSVRAATVSGTTNLAQFASATFTWWTAQTGGIQHTDLLDMDGDPLSSVVSDAFGNVPQFKAPDEVIEMWGSADGGTRILFLAVDIGKELKTRVAANTTAIANIAAGESAIDSVARTAATVAQAAADTAQDRADDAYTLAEAANSSAVVDQTARDSAATANATANEAAADANAAQIAAGAAQATANQALADVNDHGALAGLDDDDHPQYHTDARGDARYPTKAELAAAGVSAPTVSTVMRRDAAGRAQVVAPSAAGDIATKGYVDGAGTSLPTASAIARRDASGRLRAVDPVDPADVATRGWVLAQDFGSGAAPVPFAPMSYGGDLTIQANPDYWYKNTSGGVQTITGLDAQLDVAPTGSGVTFRLYVDGTGIVGDACIVAAAATGGTVTFGTPYSLAAGARVGIIVTAVGATTPGSRAVVQLLGDPAPGGGSGTGLEIRDEGTVLGTVTKLNFAGTGVAASVASGVGTVTISGGGGGGSGGIVTVGMPGSGATFIVDNTAGANIAIQAALAAVGKRGAIKQLPGIYQWKAPVVMQREQVIEGPGGQAAYNIAAVGWAGEAMIMNNFAELDSVRHRVYGLALDAANRAPRCTYFGINGTPTVWSPDPAPDFDTLFLTSSTGNLMDFGGSYSGSMREARIHNCRFQHGGGWSVNLNASDAVISHCTSQGSDGGGYNLAQGNIRSIGNKAYSTGVVGAPRPGFRIGTSGTVSGCEAQDTYGNGFELWGPDIQIDGCVADSTGDGVTSTQSCGFWVSSGALAPTIRGKAYHRNGRGAIWKAAGAGQRHSIGFQTNGTMQKVLASIGTGNFAGAPWVSAKYQVEGPNSSVVVI